MTGSVSNLFDDLPEAAVDEHFSDLLVRPGVRVERIVSHGQSTPADAPMVEDQDEWVVLLSGAAGLRIGDGAEIILRPGDYIFIPAGTPHWVTFTSRDAPSVWLAVHLAPASQGA